MTDEQENVNTKKKFNLATCDECHEAKNRDDLTQLCGWAIYLCDECILAWINDFKTKKEK